MRKRRCLDAKCPKSVDSTLSERKAFYFHVQKKPKSKLIEICALYNLVKYPENLSLITLVNLYIDFSTEPLASKVLEGQQK